MRLSLFHILIVATCFAGVCIPQSRTDDTTLQLAISRLNSTDAEMQTAAIELLTSIGERAAVSLAGALTDSGSSVRTCAAVALGRIAPKGETAIPALTSALNDSNEDVRWFAAAALGKFGKKSRQSLPQLLNLLNDSDTDVRWAAYTAIQAVNGTVPEIAPEYGHVVATIDSLVPVLQKQLRVPGVSVCLIKNTKISWTHTYGVADVQTAKPVTGTTLFEACSMSKPVLAYIALQLVDKGRLNLDKPLYKYYPETFIEPVAGWSKRITARMILSHTSGMPNWRKAGEDISAPVPIYFQPGTRFTYSGEGMYYLQRVIEHITGKPFEKLASEMLFGKLGLSVSSFVWRPELDSLIATGYDDSGAALNKGNYRRANAAYTLYTTPEEYAKFIIAIMQYRQQHGYSLSRNSIEAMIQHQSRAETRSVMERPGRSLGLYPYRGLGWAIDSTITSDILYHGGSNQTGFRCYSQFRINEGTGIIIMTNGAGGSELWAELIRRIGDY